MSNVSLCAHNSRLNGLPAPYPRSETLVDLYGSMLLSRPPNLPFPKTRRAKFNSPPPPLRASCVSKSKTWLSCASVMRSQLSTICEEKMAWIGMTTSMFCRRLSSNSGTTIERRQKTVPWAVPWSPRRQIARPSAPVESTTEGKHRTPPSASGSSEASPARPAGLPCSKVAIGTEDTARSMYTLT